MVSEEKWQKHYNKFIYPGLAAGKTMFDGAQLFELKATYGFPLDFAIEKIFSAGWAIEWAGFIEAARRNKRWDYQTYEELQHALADAEVDKDVAKAIIDRFKVYVIANPHPVLQ